ncbi:hypothetical protein Tco_1275386 [Tanacetum coccineum]
MHLFVGNFTYVVDFMIVEDISSILDPRLSQVVLGKPFIEISNMTHDPPEGVIRFINGTDEVAYKMPHKIEQYDSLSDLEKEHTKSVYLRNEEDKRRGVEYFLFGRHLDELHVTWTHLEKKRTRLQTNTKTLKDLCSQSLETASQAIHDAVTTHQVTASSLWAKVIRGIHGEDGKLHQIVKQSHISIWLDIVRETSYLQNQGLDLCGFIHKKMGNGSKTSFWEDTWRGKTDFKSLYPMIYALESCKNITVSEKMSHVNLAFSFRRNPRVGIEHTQFTDLVTRLEGFVQVEMRDRWALLKEGSGDFSVASVRKMIDDRWLPNVSTKTRWSNVVPIKINVHAWKVRLDCLPTRLNISRRCMDIESILCPSCSMAVKSSNLGIHGLGLVIVAIGKKLVVVLVETVPASSTR